VKISSKNSHFLVCKSTRPYFGLGLIDSDVRPRPLPKLMVEIVFRSMAKEFSGVMKEVLGTAQSIGCTIDGNFFNGFKHSGLMHWYIWEIFTGQNFGMISFFCIKSLGQCYDPLIAKMQIYFLNHNTVPVNIA
jgi:hypothetical protein